MITIFAGPMFSGKTTSLIEHSHKTGIECIWKPRKDVRDSSDIVRTHNGISVRGRILDNISQITQYDTIYVDEAQFLDRDLIHELSKMGESRDVYVSMLDMDYTGKEFYNYRVLTNVNHRLIKLFSKCEVCQMPARFSYRKVESTKLILCGSKESYEPRCADHFSVLCVQGEISEHTQTHSS